MKLLHKLLCMCGIHKMSASVAFGRGVSCKGKHPMKLFVYRQTCVFCEKHIFTTVMTRL